MRRLTDGGAGLEALAREQFDVLVIGGGIVGCGAVLDDVLARRMRLVHELADRGASIVPRVAAILGRELCWDEKRRDRAAAEILVSARRECSVP